MVMVIAMLLLIARRRAAYGSGDMVSTGGIPPPVRAHQPLSFLGIFLRQIAPNGR
jgi:hypothetical protein